MPVQMAGAIRREPPADLPTLNELGYFCEKPTFTYWPVDPIGYLDKTGKRPPVLPDRFADPHDWIVNWGIAAMGAEVAIQWLNRVPDSRHANLISTRISEVLQKLHDWRNFALLKNPIDPLDSTRALSSNGTENSHKRPRWAFRHSGTAVAPAIQFLDR